LRPADLDEVQARIIPENGPPRSVLDRTGFRKERLLRSGAVIRDRHVDMLLFTLTHASGAHAARGPARTGSG
jgi:RimJ/RimL family protein N-acetyltransferase